MKKRLTVLLGVLPLLSRIHPAVAANAPLKAPDYANEQPAQPPFSLKISDKKGVAGAEWRIQTGANSLTLPYNCPTNAIAGDYALQSVVKSLTLNGQTAMFCKFTARIANQTQTRIEAGPHSGFPPVPNDRPVAASSLASRSTVKSAPNAGVLEVVALVMTDARGNNRSVSAAWTAARLPEDENGCLLRESQSFDFNADGTLTRTLARFAVESVPYRMDCGCCDALQTRTVQTAETIVFGLSANGLTRQSYKKEYVTQENDTSAGILRKAFGGPEKIARMLKLNPWMRDAQSLPGGKKVLIEKE